MRISTKIFITILTIVCLPGCLEGGNFFKQSGEQSATFDIKQVETIIEDGKTIGTISANDARTQLLKASDETSIAGSSVEFPVGSLAIDSQISLGEGGEISDDLFLQQLAISNSITNAGFAVELKSSESIDATQPFTLNIPLPSGSSLLAGENPNLVVFYFIKKAALKKSFKGVFTRSQLSIKDGFVRFTTNHFGTFQAAITENIIPAPIEVSEDAVNVAAKRSVRFRRGVRTLMSHDNQGQIQDGFQAWLPAYGPTKVKNTNTFTSWYQRSLVQ